MHSLVIDNSLILTKSVLKTGQSKLRLHVRVALIIQTNHALQLGFVVIVALFLEDLQLGALFVAARILREGVDLDVVVEFAIDFVDLFEEFEGGPLLLSLYDAFEEVVEYFVEGRIVDVDALLVDDLVGHSGVEAHVGQYE